MRKHCSILAGAIITAMSTAAYAQDGPILFTNVDVFDGVNETLMEDVNVVVTGNTISQISSDDIAVAGGQVIDGTGHTLMPGLIDSHTHLMFSGITFPEVLFQRSGYQAIQGVVIAEQTLMNGVTTVRDMAGDVFDLKRAIDEGTVPGPRVRGQQIASRRGNLGAFRGLGCGTFDQRRRLFPGFDRQQMAHRVRRRILRLIPARCPPV